jgi:hypothetical protein
MAEKFDLVRGPQDGAKITGVGIPEVVYVGRKWMGDGYAAWGREQSNRFPEAYRRNWVKSIYEYTPEPQ